MEYPWAVNRVKLSQAISKLQSDKRLNPTLIITEDMVKEEYVKRAGLLTSEAPVIVNKQVVKKGKK